MDKLYVPLLILLTSLAGYFCARRMWHIQREDIVRAIQRALEFIGCWVLVYIANLLFGLVLILLIRRLTGFFVSLYVLNSIILVLFTLLQALVAHHLWQRDRRQR